MTTRARCLALLSCVVIVTATWIYAGDNSPPANENGTAARVRELEKRIEALELQLRERHAQPQKAVPRQRDYSNSYYTFSGAYETTEAGVTKLPLRCVWEVVPSNGGGLDPQDPRIMLRLHDHQLHFLPVTAQMDITTAQRLHHDLGKMIISRLQTHGKR